MTSAVASLAIAPIPDLPGSDPKRKEPSQRPLVTFFALIFMRLEAGGAGWDAPESLHNVHMMVTSFAAFPYSACLSRISDRMLTL